MITDELVERVKREEGFSRKIYLDHLGNATIGYGTLLEEGVSEAEAELLLRHRLGAMAEEVARSERGAVFGRLAPAAREALLDMAYNMGVPALLGFRRMWAALARGDYGRAAAEALDSEYARQAPARAARVAAGLREAEGTARKSPESGRGGERR